MFYEVISFSNVTEGQFRMYLSNQFNHNILLILMMLAECTCHCHEDSGKPKGEATQSF